MSVAAPAWLAKRGGAFRPGTDGLSWLVVLDKEPQYLIKPHPAAGKFGCEVLQTNNGKRLGSNSIYTSEDAALHGGLEDLRKALGW